MQAAVGKAVVTAQVEVGTEVWLSWAHVAIEQAQIAHVARATITAQVAAGEPFDLNAELHPALITIAAVATSLDGFATEVEKTGIPIQTPSAQQPTRLWMLDQPVAPEGEAVARRQRPRAEQVDVDAAGKPDDAVRSDVEQRTDLALGARLHDQPAHA